MWEKIYQVVMICAAEILVEFVTEVKDVILEEKRLLREIIRVAIKKIMLRAYECIKKI